MKVRSKVATWTGLGLLSMVTVVSAALPVFAEPTTTPTTDPTTGNSSAICKQIQNLDTARQAAVATKITAMQSDFASRISSIENRQQTVDPKIDDARTKSQKAFDDKIQGLLNRNDLTDAQKTAVKTFQTSVKEAEKTRQDAVDAARTTYRDALMEAVGTHQNNLAAAATTFKASVATAFTTAETTGCDASTLATLRTDVKAARATFAADRTADKVTADIKDLMQTRNQAIKDANAAFVKAVSGYTATLKKSLNL